MLSVSLRKQLGTLALEVDFEMQGPGIIALFGRSGSGKTSVINLLAGLLRADRGRISLDDELLLDSDAGVDLPAQRRRIGYVFQDGRLFPHLDVAANLGYGLRRARATVVGLEEIVTLLDLAPLMSRRIHRLSGGEKQRVAIGRALLSQPRLLLLDEPLAALDAARREEVLPYLDALRDSLSLPMVYVSHDFEEVRRLATQLVLLEAGHVTAQGPVAEMSLHAGVRAIVGTDSIGAVLEGRVLGPASDGLLEVQMGTARLLVESPALAPGRPIRVQIMARDVIVATQEPHGLSVRNALRGVIREVAHDDASSDLVFIEAGGSTLVARISKLASRELQLRPALPVFALVKAVALRGTFDSRR